MIEVGDIFIRALSNKKLDRFWKLLIFKICHTIV